jgi:hypothetical protein
MLSNIFKYTISKCQFDTHEHLKKGWKHIGFHALKQRWRAKQPTVSVGPVSVDFRGQERLNIFLIPFTG